MIDKIKRAWNSFILLFTFKEEIEYVDDGELESFLKTNNEKLPEELVEYLKNKSDIVFNRGISWHIPNTTPSKDNDNKSLPEKVVERLKDKSNLATDKHRRDAMKKEVFDGHNPKFVKGMDNVREEILKEYGTHEVPSKDSDMSNEERLKQALSNIEKNAEITKERLRDKQFDGIKELSNAEVIQKWSFEGNCLKLVFMDGNELELEFSGRLVESKANINRVYELSIHKA